MYRGQYGSDYDTIATISTNKQWDMLFQNTDLIIPIYAMYCILVKMQLFKYRC